ncbi:MAG: hypothetical protein IK020_11965 [Clostridiales bacterium]|nr:hypothetical protein [Clostridiales bacterium]
MDGFWFAGIALGLLGGIGGALLLMSWLLRRSNIIGGESKPGIDDFTVGVTFTSKEDFGPVIPGPIFDSYAELAMTMFTNEKSMVDYACHKLSAPPFQPVERYIPKPGDENVDVEAVKAELRKLALLSDSPENKMKSAAAGSPKEKSGKVSGSSDAQGAVPGSSVARGTVPGSSEATTTDAMTSKGSDAGDALPEFDPNEPIYEAPTATRPLWENDNPDDDFSDFEQ